MGQTPRQSQKNDSISGYARTGRWGLYVPIASGIVAASLWLFIVFPASFWQSVAGSGKQIWFAAIAGIFSIQFFFLISARIDEKTSHWLGKRMAALSLFTTVVLMIILGLSFLVISWLLWGAVGLKEAARATASLTTAAGIGGVVALVVSYRKHALTERGQADARFTEAVRLLGEEHPSTRIAGVYALVNVADKYPALRQQTIDILCGYLRTKREDDGPVESTIINKFEEKLNPAEWSKDQKLDLDLRDATFTEEFNIDKAVIGQCNFNRATFINSVWFSDVTFESVAQFKETTFRGDARFVGATFRTYVSFYASDFELDAFFNGASFPDGADFIGAKFKDSAWFTLAKFSDHASFSFANFESTAGFNETKFNSKPQFDKVTFNGIKDFTGCTVDGHIVKQDYFFDSDTVVQA